MHNLTLSQLAKGLANKEFSSVELTQHFLKRSKEQNSQLNAFINQNETAALEQAAAADKTLAAGAGTALTGIPLAYKDNICTTTEPTTAASKMLENYRSPFVATLVEKLNAAGAVNLGKTNLDEFALGTSTATSYFGASKNPFDLEASPGGSSGGSAVAVAAGLAAASLGTDTGGSIRQPAVLNGLTGLKPTYGRVSRLGLVAVGTSLEQAGPIARTAEDCALILQAIAGKDEADVTTSSQPVEDYASQLANPIKGIKIGLPKEYFAVDLQPEVAALLEAAKQNLQALGAELVEVSLPHTHYAAAAYQVLGCAEISTNLSRYDGVRFGYRCENPEDLDDLYSRSRGEAFGAEVKKRILLGSHYLLEENYAKYFISAQKARRLISEDFAQVFGSGSGQVDLLLTPACLAPAAKLSETPVDAKAHAQADFFFQAANLAGIPALALPLGLVAGLPVGMQLLGPAFSEAKLLNLGHQLQTAHPEHIIFLDKSVKG